MRELTKEFFFIDISKEDILLVERKFSIVLPEYLRTFFLKYNGARTKEYRFHNEVDYLVSSFLPLLENRNASVELILPAIRDEEEGIGRYDLIPFATDPGGRPFYVAIGGDDIGVVYYDLIGLAFNEPLRKIADSFEEFIDGLQPRQSQIE
jgi:hypothetical protein